MKEATTRKTTTTTRTIIMRVGVTRCQNTRPDQTFHVQRINALVKEKEKEKEKERKKDEESSRSRAGPEVDTCKLHVVDDLKINAR